jgi:hypothetical protein
MVDQTSGSWNRVTSWLRDLDQGDPRVCLSDPRQAWLMDADGLYTQFQVEDTSLN